MKLKKRCNSIVIVIVSLLLVSCSFKKEYQIELLDNIIWTNLTEIQRTEEIINKSIEKFNLTSEAIVVGSSDVSTDEKNNSIEAPIAESLSIVDREKLIQIQSNISNDNSSSCCYNAYINEDKEKTSQYIEENYPTIMEYINALGQIDYSMFEGKRIDRSYYGLNKYSDIKDLIEKQNNKENCEYYIVNDKKVVNIDDVEENDDKYLLFRFFCLEEINEKDECEEGTMKYVYVKLDK